MRNVTFVFVLLLTTTCYAAEQPDANRLTYLDAFYDPYYPSLEFPKLVTPQWVGEDGVEAVVTLGIDDMRGVANYERYLRPILERLKEIDGRAPVSILTNSINPKEPHLQKWLREGVTIETHTADHPCPCLHGGSLDRARSTYERCVDQMASIKGNRPVAFRFPCCDSLNTPSPRAYAEIINRTTVKGNFLQISSSICAPLTAADPALPRELVIDRDGRPRFTKYIPFKSFVNKVENYPYPFVIGRLCWEFPIVVPDDWQGQNLHRSGNPQTVEDLKAAIDAVVIKQGTANVVFHPGGWMPNHQMLSVIEHLDKKHGRKIRFLNFRECIERINKHLLAGHPLRAANGQDNGVRLLDLNGDGYLDVVIGNERARKTRLWDPKTNRWRETAFPVRLVTVDAKGNRRDAGGRFGVVRGDGKVTFLIMNKKHAGAWYFDGAKWVADKKMALGLREGGEGVLTAIAGRDRGVRLRDLNRDGRCELLVANPTQQAAYSWDLKTGAWKRLPFTFPKGSTIVDAKGRDAGLRFIDVDEDGFDDVLFSNESRYSLHLFESMEKGWNHEARAAVGRTDNAIPMISRAGTNNGAWFAKRHMWLQNEDTNRMPDGVDRRSFGDLLGDNPPPKNPNAALRSMQVRQGFSIELVAAEPLVADPIYFDWGLDGRLWVVEMADYPLGLDDRGKPGGRIRLLEDTDADGKYDKSTLFLDGIPFPTAVMPWRRGVLVSAAPSIFYAEDTDGDGKADRREVLFTGFVEGNQQHRVNGFVWGLDNWIHIANGDSGGRIKSLKTGKTINIAGRDLRIRPDTGEIDTQTGYSQFGRFRDDWGNWFGCNNSNPITHFVLADEYLRRNPHYAAANPRVTIASTGNTRIYPISRVLSHWEGYRRPGPGQPHRFTSASGTRFYRDDLFGSTFSNNTFTCEPVHNLIHRRVLLPQGATFTSRRVVGGLQQEFVASRDSWFRPTLARTGPDGALWIADMYRLVIEHPTWINDAAEKKLHLRAGHDRGRIYRVVPKNSPRRKIPALAEFSTKQLVAALDSPNGWQRDQAQHSLVERQDQAAIPLLKKLVSGHSRPLTRLHALCSLDGLGAVEAKLLVVALKDEHPGMRRHAARLAGSMKSIPDALAKSLAALVDDADVHVRIEVAQALGQCHQPSAVGALAKMLTAKGQDPHVTATAMSSLNKENVGTVVLSRLEHGAARSSRLTADLMRMASLFGANSAVFDALTSISRPNPQGKYADWQLSALIGILDALDQRKTPLAKLLAARGDKHETTLQRTKAMFVSLRKDVVDDDTPIARRLLILRLLGRGPWLAEGDFKLISDLIVPQSDVALQLASVDTLGRTGHEKAPELLTQRWESHGPKVRRAVLNALLARRRWQDRLLELIAAKTVRADELSASQREQLLNHEDAAVRRRAGKALAQSTDTDRAKVVAMHQKALTLRGDDVRGLEVFKKSCSACHRVRNIGKNVGPDLKALSSRSPQAMLIAILDPNRAVEDRYRSYTALTVDGLQVTGVLTSETASNVTLADSEGRQHVILRSNLERLRNTGKSLMPEGVEKDLSQQQLADVIALIGKLGPPPKKFPDQKPQVVASDAKGVLNLPATHAEIYGKTLIFEGKYNNLGFWSSLDDRAAWTIDVAKSGKYDVYLDWAVDQQTANNPYLLQAGVEEITGRVKSTASWDDYRQAKIGAVRLKQGRQRVTFRSGGALNGFLVDLRAICLVPSGQRPPDHYVSATGAKEP